MLAHHMVEGERGAQLRLEIGGGSDVLLGHHLADDLARLRAGVGVRARVRVRVGARVGLGAWG